MTRRRKRLDSEITVTPIQNCFNKYYPRFCPPEFVSIFIQPWNSYAKSTGQLIATIRPGHKFLGIPNLRLTVSRCACSADDFVGEFIAWDDSSEE
jgi:hypothetical protein